MPLFFATVAYEAINTLHPHPFENKFLIVVGGIELVLILDRPCNSRGNSAASSENRATKEIVLARIDKHRPTMFDSRFQFLWRNAREQSMIVRPVRGENPIAFVN